MAVSLTWTDNASNENQFEVHAITDGTYAGIFSANATAYTINSPSYGTSRCYEVRAKNAAGSSGYSNSVCVTPMAQASLSSPANGYQYPSGTGSANLSWGAVSGASSYGINVSYDPPTQGANGILTNLLISNQAAAGTSATVYGLSNGQTYNWQVIAYNANGSSRWSSWRSLSVAAPTPAVPVLSSPANGYYYPTGTTATTIYWNSSSNSDSYDVQVGGSCGDTSVYFGNTTSLNKAISGLGSGQTYNWQVRGRNNSGGVSSYSSCYSFTIAPPVPNFSSPADAYAYPAGTTSTILYWNSATGATSYDLQVGGSCGATNIFSGNTTFLNRTVSGLTNGQTYYWRMQANNAAGASGYSSCRSFTVGASAPPPTVTAITANTGLNNASLSITDLAGTNFVSGATVKLTKSGQSDIAATNVVFVNSTKLTCTLPITGAAVGAWNVVVTNPDAQSATLSNGFTVTGQTYVLTVASLVPASGVSITVSPADNASQTNGSTQFTRTYNSGTSVTLTAPATAGGNNFVKWQRDGVDYSVAQGVTFPMSAAYTMTAVYVPTYSLTITAVNAGTSLLVLVNGVAHMTPVTLTFNGGSLVELDAVVNFSFPAGYYIQKWQLDGVDSNASVTMNANHTMTATVMAPPPTIASITPLTGLNNASINITNLAGANFVSGATVKLTKAGQSDIVSTDVGFLGSTQLTCTLPITGAAVGLWNVVVTNPDTQSVTLANGFMITSLTAPTLTAITPGAGSNAASLNITNLAGTNFVSGSTVKLTKSGQADISATNVTVVSATQITCTLPISGAAAGAWNVVVTNPDTQSASLTNGFTVTAAPSPAIISRSPASMSFTGAQGGANPASQILSISNSGGGTLSWSVSDDAAWLSLSPASGSSTGETDSVTVSVNTSGLAAGAYFGTISIAAAGATNTPQTTGVTLTVTPVTALDPYDTADDTAGNGTQLTATTAEQAHGTHSLGGTDLTDWYRISMTAGYTYYFNTIGGTGDNFGELYSDSAGTNLVASNDDGGGNLQFSFAYTAAATQTYYLKVRPYSSENSWSGSLKYRYSVLAAPNQPAIPAGGISLTTSQSEIYSAVAIDPGGYQVMYGWDWNGDGVCDEWSGLMASGTADSRPHAWAGAGVYLVRVIAQNSFGVDSAWSAALTVSVSGLIDKKQEDFKTSIGDNLFNPKTGGTSKIKFTVPRSGRVSLKIYNIAGKLMRTLFEGESGIGDTQKDWDGKDDSGRYVPPSVYFLHYVYPGGKEVRKIGVRK